MALDTFNFPYHTFETDNPTSGVNIQLGGSYMFTTPPTDPDQRIFTLSFPAMKYYVGEDGLPEAGTEPTKNMKTLSDFYRAHLLYKSFLYPHPVYGTLEVKFNKPLKEPKVTDGGMGVVKDITIELVEIP